MGPIARRLRALERRIGDRDFNAGGPPLDEDGLPCWDGTPGLPVESYTKALGASPDADLTEPELEARDRLVPYREVFDRLARDATEKEAGT